MVFPDSIDALHPRHRVTVEEFSNRYHDAMEALEQKKYDEARAIYVELLRLYQQLQEGKVDPIHTNIAYSCIEDLYNDLQHKVEVPVVSPTGLRVGIGASLLVILLGIFIIANPAYVGLTTLSLPTIQDHYWQGPSRLVLGGPYTFNVNEYVDAWDLTYLVTQGEGLRAYLDGSILTLVPDRGFSGSTSITLYGYNMGDKPNLVFKQTLAIQVAEK